MPRSRDAPEKDGWTNSRDRIPYARPYLLPGSLGEILDASDVPPPKRKQVHQTKVVRQIHSKRGQHQARAKSTASRQASPDKGQRHDQRRPGFAPACPSHLADGWRGITVGAVKLAVPPSATALTILSGSIRPSSGPIRNYSHSGASTAIKASRARSFSRLIH
jgi:hypothetical protein